MQELDQLERSVLDNLDAAKTAFDILRRAKSDQYTITDQGMFEIALVRAREILFQADRRSHEHKD